MQQNLTEAEKEVIRRQRKAEYQRRWYAKQREKKAAASVECAEAGLCTTGDVTTVDYKKMYTQEAARVRACGAKINELERICENYAKQAETANNTLRKATMEYDARIKFALDAVRHAYTAIQLASMAQDKKGE